MREKERADLRSLALPPGIYYPKPPAAVLVLSDDLSGGVAPASAFPAVHDPEGLRQRWQYRFGAVLLLVLLAVAVAVVDVDVEGCGLLGVPADPVGGEALAGAEDPGGGVGLVLRLRRLGRLGHEDASGAAGPGGRHGLPSPASSSSSPPSSTLASVSSGPGLLPGRQPRRQRPRRGSDCDQIPHGEVKVD